jgi:hypothetical protein
MKKPNRSESSIQPDRATLAKIGSILVHVSEAWSSGGHGYDWTAARQLMADPDVQRWLENMRKATLLPLKRN